jgi:hypothetical protein
MSARRAPREPQPENRIPDTRTSWGPAILVGAVLVAGAVVVRSSLEETNRKLDEMRSALDETRQAVRGLAAARPSPPQQRGPDPNRRYDVNTAGAPAKGPATAKIRVVEFSDFQ